MHSYLIAQFFNVAGFMLKSNFVISSFIQDILTVKFFILSTL